MRGERGRHHRIWIAACVACLFWIGDSSIHFFAYHEPGFEVFPADFNEGWMRALICLLIISVGVVLDRHAAIVAAFREREDAVRARLHQYEDIFGNTMVGLHLLLRGPDRSRAPEVFYGAAKAAVEDAFERFQNLQSEVLGAQR